MERRVMARRGEGCAEIAKQLGCSRNTVRCYLRDEDAQRYGPRAPHSTKLEPHHPYLRERIELARPRWIPAAVASRAVALRLSSRPPGLARDP